jgi:hypothetical protein
MFVCASVFDQEEITVSDFLDDRRKEITDRLKELEPVVDEVRRLEAAAVALAEAVGSTVGSAASEAGSAAVATVTRRRGPGRPRGSSTGKRGPGRPRGSGKRGRKAAQASTPAATTATTADVTPATVQRKKPGRPKGSGKKVGRPKARRGGRPKGGGKRAAEALSFVQGQPGITIPELAAKMGIKQNYLYRVIPGLEREGKLEKKGRGWYPKGA